MSSEEIEQLLDDALRLLQAGAFAEAEQIYRQILAADPDTADAWNNLALICYQDGRLGEAAEAVERALLLRPQLPPYWLMRGNIALAQHRGDDAQESFTRAIELAPDFAEAHYRRALGYHRAHRIDEAVAGYREAARCAPEVAEIHFQLAEALTLRFSFDDAMRAYQRAFTLDAGGELDRRGCIDCMRHLQFESLPEFWRAEITRFFARTDVDKTRYVGVGLQALAVRREFRVVLLAARQGDARFERGSVALRDVMRDELFMLLMRDALIADPEFEILLTRLRADLSRDDALRAQAPLEFLCALAVQCFNNEYVFAESAAENAQAAALQRAVEAQLQAGRVAPDSMARSVAVLAMYRPLNGVAGIELLTAQPPNPSTLAQLLKLTVTNLATERALRQEIRVIGEISDEVSREVRGMYEENPYPRWFTVDRWPPIPFAEWLEREVPMSEASGGVTAAPRILVAGCGTGQDAIWLATDIAGASVLAVDLSLASLAYAQRMANELGARNIEFCHRDILGLGSLAERFDLVYANGVLHHLREPAAGLRVLSTLVRPGGLLKVGLYSERARASANAAREIVRARQSAPTATAIREFRQQLYAAGQASPLQRLVSRVDFYSTSMCRDMIFHVHEHQFRLPQVVAMLRERGLTVLGLSDLPRNAVAEYCRMFPGAEVTAGFENWDALEAQNPETFINLYQVWSRRPVVEGAPP